MTRRQFTTLLAATLVTAVAAADTILEVTPLTDRETYLVGETVFLKRAAVEASGSCRPVVLATLPDELHGLSLHIVGLAVAAAGRTVRVLGPHLPVDEIAQAADVLDAAAVGISVSIFGAGSQTTSEVTTLRESLSPRTGLWIGGSGAAYLEGLGEGVTVIATLDDLESELLKL